MAFATYRDIVSGSSGSSKSSKISTYQDIKKSITPTQFEENRKKLQETNDRNLQIERQKKQEEVLKKSQAETEKYLQDFNDASTGFGGSILKRFGIGATAPTLAQSPVTQSPAYQQSQQIGTENTSNLGKTVGANIKEAAKSLFTENTTNSVYDIAHQSGVDKQNLDVIENNTKKIVELHNKKKISTDQAESKKIDTAIGFLLEQNRQVAEQVGGEIKDKSNLQLLGQSVGTAMELLPIGVGSGMTQAGKLILEAGTKQALKALGKEAALYGATVASSGKAQEKGATAGDVATSGVIGGLTGLATIAIPGLAKWATKDGGKYIQNLFKKISTDGTQSLSKEEAAALKEIVTSKEEVPNNTSVTEQQKTEVKTTPEDTLIQEARKYGSAEEFVKAQKSDALLNEEKIRRIAYSVAKNDAEDRFITVREILGNNKKAQEIFKDILDTRISVFDNSHRLLRGGNSDSLAGYITKDSKTPYAGSIVLRGGESTVNLEETILEEMFHALRDSRGKIGDDLYGGLSKFDQGYKEAYNSDIAELLADNATNSVKKLFKINKTSDYYGGNESQLTDIWKKAQEKPIDTSLPEQLKPDVTPTTVEKGESVTAKKMNERFGKDEQMSTEYDVIGINNESDKAASLILKDRNKAIKTAFTDTGSNTEKIAILNELFEKSVVDNDHELSTVLFNRIKQLSTQTAQSLNMFKALTEVNPHYSYMSEVVSARLNGVRLSAGNIIDALKKESKQSRVRTKLSKQTQELKETLSNSVKYEKAQKVFNDLIC